jgi:hypothetical protein
MPRLARRRRWERSSVESTQTTAFSHTIAWPIQLTGERWPSIWSDSFEGAHITDWGHSRLQPPRLLPRGRMIIREC